jgi:hypothetical protein
VGDDAIPSLSGAIVLRNIESFRRLVGTSAVERGYAALPDAQRARLQAAVPAAWLSTEDVDALYTAIADAAGEKLMDIYPSVVRDGVERTLRSVWKVLLRVTTPRALLKRAPIVYGRSHSVGTVVPTVLSPGRARVDLTGWPGMSNLRRVGVATGIETLLAVAGRKNPKATFRATDDGAVFQLTWEP